MKNNCNQNRFYFLLAIFSFTFFLNNISAQTLSKSDTSNVQWLNSRKFYIYKVNKGETLFSISQKFKIPQEEIADFNHDIQKTGLKAKMKLWIPAYSWVKKDSVAVVPPKEIKIESPVLKVAVVTLLDIPKTYTAIDSSENYIDEPLRKDIKDNLEFVEGVMFASEKMKSEGLKIHLYIIDSENDSLRMLNKLRKHGDIDLIITNEMGRLLKGLSKYSQLKDIKLFSSGLNTLELIKENKNAFTLLPSAGKQCEEMGKFSARYFHDSHLVTIKTSISKENERTEFFRLGWKKYVDKAPTMVIYGSGGGDAVADCLEKNTSNVVFISSSNEDFVSSVLTALSKRTAEFNFKVVGLPTWQYFETIDQNLIEKCNVYVFSSGFIDYDNDTVLSFRKFFRDKYYAEPSEISYQGYDAILAGGRSFLANGKKIIDEEKLTVINGIYSDYFFARSGTDGAFENPNIHVFQPSADTTKDLVKELNMK